MEFFELRQVPDRGTHQKTKSKEIQARNATEKEQDKQRHSRKLVTKPKTWRGDQAGPVGVYDSISRTMTKLSSVTWSCSRRFHLMWTRSIHSVTLHVLSHEPLWGSSPVPLTWCFRSSDALYPLLFVRASQCRKRLTARTRDLRVEARLPAPKSCTRCPSVWRCARALLQGLQSTSSAQSPPLPFSRSVQRKVHAETLLDTDVVLCGKSWSAAVFSNLASCVFCLFLSWSQVVARMFVTVEIFLS